VRVFVDPDLCQGHTLCNMVAPEIFSLREEDGHAFVTVETIAPAGPAQDMFCVRTSLPISGASVETLHGFG